MIQFVLLSQKFNLQQFPCQKYKIYRKGFIPTVRARKGVVLVLKNNVISQETLHQTNVHAVAVRSEILFRATLCSQYLPDKNLHITDLHRLLVNHPHSCILMKDFNAHCLF